MSEERKYCVYKHTSKIDGRAYVGITRVGVKQRWHSGKGYKRNQYFWRYIQKYGWDSLEHEILYDDLSEEDAVKIEKKLIAEWDLTNRDKGFNLDLGGSTNNTFWRGVYCIETHSEYDGTRIAERETGVRANNICYACNGKRQYAGKDANGKKFHWVYSDEKWLIPQIINNCMFQKEYLNLKEESLFEEYKNKCIRRSVSRTREDLRKNVYQYDLQGELLAVYSGLEEAATATKSNMSEIGQRCNGVGFTCGGYLWSYSRRSFSEDELLAAQNASNHQTILQYDFDMNLVAEYVEGNGLKENNSKYQHVRNVCRRFKDSAYGYVWRFKGESQEQFDVDKEYYANKKPSSRDKKIAQYTKDGQLVKIYQRIVDVEKDGWGRNMVSLCCRGKKDMYRNYIWKYAN